MNKAEGVSHVESEDQSAGFISQKFEIIKFTLSLINEHGVLSLYDGMTSSIVGSVVQYAIYFCSSKFFGYALESAGWSMGHLTKTMLINLVSATCTAIVTNPIWVVNARMARKNKEVRVYA